MVSMVANGIRRSIERKGLYKKFVAEQAGFTEQQLCDMLNGRKIIRAEYIPSLAKAIGVEIPEIYAAGQEST